MGGVAPARRLGLVRGQLFGATIRHARKCSHRFHADRRRGRDLVRLPRRRGRPSLDLTQDQLASLLMTLSDPPRPPADSVEGRFAAAARLGRVPQHPQSDRNTGPNQQSPRNARTEMPEDGHTREIKGNE
jgi:hypothetical protein